MNLARSRLNALPNNAIASSLRPTSGDKKGWNEIRDGRSLRNVNSV